MKSTILKAILTTALATPLLTTSVEARIDAPDHVIYGNASLYGNPAAPGNLIELHLIATGEVLVRYELGRDDRLGDQYALRIPMDAVDPRVDGRARPGDPIQIYIAGELAAETTVGDEGTAVRLDIDPQNLGTGPSLSISDQTLFEGNAGTKTAVFDVTLNTTDSNDVVLFWQTLDDTATGGVDCGDDVTDYLIESNRQLVISPGQTEAQIGVVVCGDTRIEDTERFILDVVGVQNGVPTRPEAFATIIDDDDVPTLQIADVTVIEPAAGQTAAAVFRPRLSKNSDFEARVNYQTVPLNAVPGVDYTPVSGSITIPAGDLEALIQVPVLNAPNALPPRSFFVTFDNPFNLLIDDDRGLGLIIDRAFRPAVEVEQSVVNQQDVTGLADPTALALSPDGNHAYVVSEALDTVLQFARNEFSGQLTLDAQYSPSTPGFEDALLGGPLDIRVSPDGETVYVASRTDNAVAVLARDAASGDLSFVENQVDGQMSTPSSSQPNAGLAGVRRLLVSADGHHVYAAGADANGIAVFARDGVTGGLSFLEAELSGVDDPDDAGGVVEAMSRPSGIVESPDGAQIYIASRFGDAIQVFERDTALGSPDHGRLNYVTALRDGLAGITGLDGAFDLVISPDGEQLYVTAENDNAVTVFDRDAAGVLTLRRVITKQVPEVPGLGGPQGLAMSPDGLEVFVTGFADDSLTIFRRLTEEEDGLQPGDLVVRQTLFDDQGSVLHMAGPTDVDASADNEFLYVVANEDNALLVLSRISLDIIFFDGLENP